MRKLGAWLESLDAATQWVAAAAIGAALTIVFIGLGYIAPPLWDALPVEITGHPFRAVAGLAVGFGVLATVYATFRNGGRR